jgi:glycosyltransferase involved in cell wall biosynthesis
VTAVAGCAGLRIAHLIESSGPGGAERILVHLAAALQQAGAENVAFVRAGGEEWIHRELERFGIPIELYRLAGPWSPECVRTLTRAFRRRRISVAHSHEFSMAVYGAWASFRAGIRHVVTMHGGRYYAQRLRRRAALRAALLLSAGTVAVSTSVAEALARDLGISRSRILTIPNGVPYEPGGRGALRDELSLVPGDRLIVSVGNLYPVKGHHNLIDAVALLKDAHPTAHVAIAGRGALMEPLRIRAAEHGLEDRVHLLGLRSDVPAVLAASDIFALPSLSEGLPLSLLEAMFAGRPIVATEVGDIAVALAQGDAGVLIPPGSPSVLAAALDRLLRKPDEAEALGARAAARAAQEYGMGRMVDRYVAVYRAAMGRAGAVPESEYGRALSGRPA